MKVVLFTCLLMLTLAAPAAAQPVSIGSLMENPALHDQEVVSVKGEVIGDVMIRGQHAWVNVGDDSGVIGVFMPALDARDLTPGRYGRRGNIIMVKGTFNRACIAHGGDMDIHALQVRRVSDAHLVPQPVAMPKFYFAVALGIVYLVLLARAKAAGKAKGTKAK